MCFLVLSILTLFSVAQSAKLSCSGCEDPVEAFTVWTDDSDVWQCESLRRRFVDKCSDEAEISCGREDDLGGSLYIMTFPKTPDDVGIKPDHLNCVSGEWKIQNRTRAQNYILCDQFIIEGRRSGTDTTDYSDLSPDGPETSDDYTEPSDEETTEPMETEGTDETQAAEETTEMATSEAMETTETSTVGTSADPPAEVTTAAPPMADVVEDKTTVLPSSPKRKTRRPRTTTPEPSPTETLNTETTEGTTETTTSETTTLPIEVTVQTLVETKNKGEDQTTTQKTDKPPKVFDVVPKRKTPKPRTTTTESVTTQEVQETTLEELKSEEVTTVDREVATTVATQEMQGSTTVSQEFQETGESATEAAMTTETTSKPSTTTKTTFPPGYDEFGIEIPPNVKIAKPKFKRPNSRKPIKKGFKKQERNGSPKKNLRSVKGKPRAINSGGQKPLRSPPQTGTDKEHQKNGC